MAGGGTGGHIFPAIAIAEELKKLDRYAEILFVGAKGRIEEKIVPSNKFRLVTIGISGIDRGSMGKNIGLPFKIIMAIRKCRQLIKEFKPDAVIGTGGFVCGPVIYAANSAGIPTLIQEGNSYAGQTIKFLSRRSGKVVINFDETRNYLRRKDNIIRIPHPIRSSLRKINRAESLEYFGLAEGKRTVFIFGGSQGARGINNGIEEIIRRLYESNLNIIWQTGKSDYERISRQFEDLKDNVKILEFIDKIDLAYSAADLVICRAGITSIMEIAYLEMASVLIPLPSSAENHQEMNARSLEKRDAAVVVLQDEIGSRLYEVITGLINDEEKLSELRKNVSKFSDPEAANKIALEVIKLIRKN